MVSRPFENTPLSFDPFPNCFSIDPWPIESTTLTFLQPKSFWDIWDLSDFHSFRVALSFQWVPDHAGLPGNKLTDSLAKTGTTLPFTYDSSPLAPVIAKIRYSRYSSW